MNSPLLSVAHVSRSFGGLRAVDDISFQVGRGDIYGIIGPNGAGKSTLFNVVAGVIPPSSGKIEFDGRDITRLPAYRKCRLGIGRTFQSAQSFAHHTVHENLLAAAFGPASSVTSWIRGRLNDSEGTRIDEILALTGLDDATDRYPADLNNLELQLLSIGMALVNRPSLLLLDEPSGGLVESEVMLLKRFLRGLNSTGLTIVVIDHKMSLIMDLCHEITVIAAGKHIAGGAPEVVASNQRVREVYLGHKR